MQRRQQKKSWEQSMIVNWTLTYSNNKVFPMRRKQQKKSWEQIWDVLLCADQGVSKCATAPLPFHGQLIFFFII